MLVFVHASVCLFLSLTSQGCPSETWVQCAAEGETCVIPNTVNSTTLAFGDDTNDLWTFAELRNYASPSASLSISCDKNTLGDIDDGESTECCYNPFGNTIDVADEFGKENEWTLAGNSDDTDFDVPYSDGLPRWVRYGYGGQYIYRLFTYQVSCDATLFGDPTGNSNNMCWYLNSVYNLSNWISCGENTAASCNLQVDSDDTDIIRIVKYGQYNSTNFADHDQFYFRFVYSKTSGNVPCNDNMFGAVGTGSTVFCYVAAVQASNFFVNPIGYWALVGECDDCILTREIEYGVTSTSTYATSSTWTKELSKTVSLGSKFLFLSTSYSVTDTVSESISTSMSEAFGVTASKSCSAQCPKNGNENGTYYLYQWVMNIGEIIDTDVNVFKAYTCFYVCESEGTVVPECPLTTCQNDNCTECSSWKGNFTE